jgi:protein CpxP
MIKKKFQTFLIVGLILSNLLLIGFVAFRKAGHMPNEGPKELIIERLHFNSDQIHHYEALIKDHRTKIRSLDRQLLTVKTKLYHELVPSKISADNKEELFRSLAQLQEKIERVHFDHFTAIRELCTDEQMGDYNLLINDIAQLFSPHPPRRK